MQKSDEDGGLSLAAAGCRHVPALKSFKILSEADGYPDYAARLSAKNLSSCLTLGTEVSPPVSDDEDDFDPSAPYEFCDDTFERKRKGAPPKMKKFGRYPFLPSMLAGWGVQELVGVLCGCTLSSRRF